MLRTIEKLKGSCTYDKNSPETIVAVRLWHFEPVDPRVQIIPRVFDGTGEQLQFLEELPHLKSLDIGGAQVSRAGLEIVARLEKLEKLELEFKGEVDAVGIRKLSKLSNLQELIVHCDRDEFFTRDAQDALTNMPRLRELVVYKSRTTNDDLAFFKPLTQLVKLKISGYNSMINDLGMFHLATLKNLEELTIVNVELSHAGLLQLAGLTKLKSLTTRPGGAVRSHNALPNCEIR